MGEGRTYRSRLRICLLRKNHHKNEPAGKSQSPEPTRACWCQNPESVREFRFYVLNSYNQTLPPGWIGQVHNLTS